MSKTPETPADTPALVTTLTEERTARRQAGKADVSSSATIPDGGAPTTSSDKRAALGKAPNDQVSRARHGAWQRSDAKAADAAIISGYVGTGGKFDDAIGKFSLTCGDRAEHVHAPLKGLVRKATINAHREV